MDVQRTEEHTPVIRHPGNADGEVPAIDGRLSTASAVSPLSALRLEDRERGLGEADVPASSIGDLGNLVSERTTDAASQISSTHAGSPSTDEDLQRAAGSLAASADHGVNSRREDASAHTRRVSQAEERDGGGEERRRGGDGAGSAPQAAAVGEPTGDPSSQRAAKEETERRQEQVASMALGLADVFGASLLRLQAAVTSAQRSQQSLDEAMARLATGEREEV